MTQIDFEKVVADQLDLVCELLISKGREYSLSGDRLESFKKAASLQGESVKQALCGMLAKHIVSIYDMSMSGGTFTEERWIEKITDSINYLLLLRAAVVEENHEPRN